MVFYGSHTISVALCAQHHLLRVQVAIFERAAAHGWERFLEYIAPSVMRELTPIVEKLMTNEPVNPNFFVASTDKYDAVIVCDASRIGGGAYVQFTGKTATDAAMYK